MVQVRSLKHTEEMHIPANCARLRLQQRLPKNAGLWQMTLSQARAGSPETGVPSFAAWSTSTGTQMISASSALCIDRCSRSPSVGFPSVALSFNTLCRGPPLTCLWPWMAVVMSGFASSATKQVRSLRKGSSSCSSAAVPGCIHASSAGWLSVFSMVHCLVYMCQKRRAALKAVSMCYRGCELRGVPSMWNAGRIQSLQHGPHGEWLRNEEGLEPTSGTEDLLHS